MSVTPLVSVLIPVYNTSNYLSQCIDSVLNQTHKNLEVIIVNDGSTDNSYEICSKYESMDKRIKLIHQNNGGLVDARKKACSVANGKFCICLDSDDYFDCDMIEKMVHLILKYEADIVCTGYIKEKENGSFLRGNFIDSGLYCKENLQKVYGNLLYSGEFYRPGIMPLLSNKLIKKDLYVKYQNMVPEVITRGEDVATIYPLLLEAKCIVIDNEIKSYHYRRNQQSICHTFDEKHFERQMILFEYLDKQIQNKVIKTQLNYYKLFGLKCGIDSYLRSNDISTYRQSKYLSHLLKDFKVKKIINNLENKDNLLKIDVIKAMYFNCFIFYIKNLKKK